MPYASEANFERVDSLKSWHRGHLRLRREERPVLLQHGRLLLHRLPATDELIVLAGYMRIVGPTLLAAFPNRIINLHPSLLPSFPGKSGIADAFHYGVKVTGITIHYVDSGIDTGPIIAQEVVRIESEDTLESLEAKIHQLEHRVYPAVIAEIIHKGDHQS